MNRVNGDSAQFVNHNKTETMIINDNDVIAKDMGNNPMVGATVACAVAVEEAMKA